MGFVERLETWVEAEDPFEDLRLAVTRWIFTRQQDPYQGVRREPGFDNLWFGTIPGTSHGGSQVVVCAYWIEERTHTVRCDSFASLSRPT